MPPSGIRDFFEIVSTMKEVISLGIGEPDFASPWHIREAAIYSLERGITNYTSNLGLLSLRKAIAGYLKTTLDLDYDPAEDILITVGVSEGLDLALRAILEPGDEVIYHEPCYVSYNPLVAFAHGVPVAVETSAADGFRLTRNAVEAKITPRTKALLLNFPNNPTGAALDPADVQALADLAVERDLLVITDEIYGELTYDGTHRSIAALPGMHDRTIFLHGFSKAWAMTGLRLGFACAPAPLVGAMMKIHQYSMLCAPVTSQEAALEALRRPAEDIQGMKDHYRRRRNYMTSCFRDMGLDCSPPRGAFYAFPSIQGLGVTSREFALRLLDEEQVAVVPGTAFGACGEGYVRCSYATSLDQVKEAMTRMARFVDRLRKG